MPTRLSAPVSTGHSRHSSPTPNFSVPLSHSLTGVPLPTSGHAEISSPKPFVWFRAKTDKGIVCLVDHLHSVTLQESAYEYTTLVMFRCVSSCVSLLRLLLLLLLLLLLNRNILDRMIMYRLLVFDRILDPIYPTPPLGQDMTQGQF